MNEQPLKTSGADVLSSRKKLRKTLWEGGGWWHPQKNMYSHCYYLIMFADVTDLKQRHNPLNIPHVVETIKSNPLKGKSFRNSQDKTMFYLESYTVLCISTLSK